MCIPSRPGRRSRKNPIDQHPSRSYGDPIIQKTPDAIRLFFQNVKGLSSNAGSEDYRYYLNCLQSLQVDIAGMAETNTCWQHAHLRADFNSVTRRLYRQSKVVYGSPSIECDPVPGNESFQSGGTLTLVTGSLASRIQGSDILDPTGLGRWTGVTLGGSNGQKLTIITAYRVCSGSIKSAPLGSAYAREHFFFQQRHPKQSINPRQFFLRDIEALILELQGKEHAIILMLDANATTTSDPQFESFIDNCSFHDLHSVAPAKSTYIGAEDRRIDYVFGCSKAMQYLDRSGTLSYTEGPQSDHRGLYVDLKTTMFQRPKSNIEAVGSRGVHTGNPELVDKFNAKMITYYEQHRMVERIDELHAQYKTMPRDEIRTALTSWDNDKGRAMQHAESALSRPPKKHKWSPELRNLAFLRLYWKLRLREVQQGKNYSATFKRWQAKVQVNDPSFTFPRLTEALSVDDIRTSLNRASTAFYKSQKDSTSLRMKCYEDLLSHYEGDSNPSTQKESRRKGNIVRNTIDGETLRNKFRDLRRVVKPSAASSLSKLLIPKRRSEGDTSTTDPYQLLQDTDPDDLIWETVVEKEEMERHLLQYNRESFRAASASPFGHGALYDAITFSGLSIPADQILSGASPPEWSKDDQAMREFLASFTLPQSVSDKPAIPSDITQDDVLRGFQSWKESTSTSPSGRHLGLYKAEIQHPVLLSCFVKFLNIAISSGISIPRWSNAVNILIEKDTGQPKINRLRIIHLFEADFNFFLKLQWGHRLVRRALSLNLLHDGQHGSIPGRTSVDPVMLTQLTADLCRVLKHDYARFDNDASACYDRIIVGLGMLAARKCGMPASAIRTHADALQFMRYTVKTVHGVSEENYQGTVFAPLFGTGQGSGASPAVWLSLVVILLQTLDRLIPDRMNFRSIKGDIVHSRLSDAFVDDTSVGFTSSYSDASIDDLIERLQHVAQTWEHLLHLSGGKLNLSKCSWFVVKWEWKQGRPVIRPIQPVDRQIHLHHGDEKGNSILIPRTQPSDSARMLGVYMNPLGDFGVHLKQLRKKADTFALRLMSPKLSAEDVRIFHRAIYVPSMRYGLASVAIDEEELGSVQSRILQSILKKLNVQSTLPTSIRHGPSEYGGLELYDLRTEVGIEALKLFRDAIYANSETGKLLRLNMQYSQLEAGIGPLLLEHPDIHLPYLTPTWILSLRQYLSCHNLTVTVSDSYTIPLQGSNDEYIMQPQHLQRYSVQQQTDINLVRLYLQASTLADISDKSNRKVINLNYLDGKRPGDFSINTCWPRQQLPTKQQIRLWKGFIKSSYLRYTPYWKNPPIASAPAPQISDKSMPQHSFADLPAFLKQLPKWQRRLIHQLDQVASDKQVWSAFQSKKRLHIASDGGLALTKGTHGWVIALGTRILFRCSGPVDGPVDTASSTRCELWGYASSLSFIDCLSKFWGLRHRCRFIWHCDSKAALSRVRKFATRTSFRRRMPSDCDLLTIIHSSSISIRRSIRRCWVRGHQDTRLNEPLSLAAKLNIAADALATEYRIHGRLQSSEKQDHLDLQQCSICINGVRLTSQFDECVRHHVNGYHLRRYIQDSRDWTDQVWNDVDFHVFSSHYRRLSSRLQITRMKIVHNQLPLGERRFKQSAIKDEVLATCPCCRDKVETMEHLLQCAENSKRSLNMGNLRRAICNSDTHPVRYLLLAGMCHWLNHGDDIPFQPSLAEFSPHFSPHLQEALNSQQAIGWDNAVKGFYSKSWRIIASMDMHAPGRTDSTKGDDRMRSIISASHEFTYATWIARNGDLHQTDDEALANIRSTELAEIRHYHGNPNLLLASDRHYCSRPIDRLVSGSAATRRRWLTRVKKSIANHTLDISRQTRIDSFFVSRTDTV